MLELGFGRGWRIDGKVLVGKHCLQKDTGVEDE
jgi:hypothetical protein